MRFFKAFLPIFLYLSFCSAVEAASNQKNYRQYYLTEYGERTTEDNPSVKYAHSIFQTLLQTIEDDSVFPVTPHLYILPRSASKWEQWAIVLQDGSIFLVENVLDLVFSDQSLPTEQEKAKLAFILGHELAHLLNDDHGKLKQKGTFLFQEINNRKDPLEAKKIEAEADQSGLLLMTKAGYTPNYIIDKGNFFLEYTKNVRNVISFQQHQKPIQRMETLKSSLQVMIKQVSIFEQGITFYKKQQYSKAIQAFQKFSTFFDGREVYNNLGLSYYQLAMSELALFDQKHLQQFMLSTVLDEETLATKLLPKDLGSPRSLEKFYQNHLLLAIQHFNTAIKIAPNYLPAKINLSSALIMDKNYRKALNVLKSTIPLSSKKEDLLNNQAIALYLTDPKKNFVKALQILQGIPEKKATYSYPYSKYNTAQIQMEQLACDDPFSLENQQNPACQIFAMKTWRPFLALVPSKKSPYLQLVQEKFNPPMLNKKQKQETRRVALVMGNGSYQNQPLANPVLDAIVVAKTLKNLGFEVDLGTELNQLEMLKKINQFGEKLGPGVTALVYYSGHGFQLDNSNFLVPLGIDEMISQELLSSDEALQSIPDWSISVNQILNKMKEAGNTKNLVILDACRNQSFIGGELKSKGLAEIDAPAGSFIAYSTSPGKISWDGPKGEHGIYTQAWLNHIQEPGLNIWELSQKVRSEVKEKTNGSQITWDTSSLDESFFFNPEKPRDLTWHFVATGLALTSGFLAREEAKEYRTLKSQNDQLKVKFQSLSSSAQISDVQSEYQDNQEKMETLRRNYETLDLLTIGALLWEGYLLVSDWKPKGEYSPSHIQVTPTETANVQLSFTWNW